MINNICKRKDFSENKFSKWINGTDDINRPLHIALQKENLLTIFKSLLTFYSEKNLNFDINVRDKEGNTVLHLAVRKKVLSIVLLLIEKGADINVINNNGETPLKIAIIDKNQEMIKLLISKEADIYIKDKNGNTMKSLLISSNLMNDDLIQIIIQFFCKAINLGHFMKLQNLVSDDWFNVWNIYDENDVNKYNGIFNLK